jgi:uncharacterized protein (DUF885 family)
MTMRLRELLLLVPIALVFAVARAQTPTVPIDDFFRDFTDEWVRQDPNLAIRSQYFDGEEQDRLSRQLTPVTKAHRLAQVRLAERGLEQLAAFDRSTMTPTQRVSAEVMHWQLERIVDGERFLDYTFPLEQMRGVNVDVPNQLVVAHPISTARDAENYVARLREADARMAEATAESERQAALGILPPRFILDVTIAQMTRFAGSAAADNPLVTEFARKLEALDDIDYARRSELVSEAAIVVENEVYPAWRAAIAVLEVQRASATDDAGLSRFDEGNALYAQQLKNFTTTDLTAAEIHRIGLDEVARIEGDMDRLLAALGYTEGTIIERSSRLSADLSYPDSAEGRQRIMADIDGMLADALDRTASSFNLRPEAPVIAQPFPEFQWANAAASYTVPPLDGSRPGIFQIPLRAGYLSQFRLRTLVYHETVPGHHYQLALAVENEALPAFRQIRAFGNISASTEGWALYAERFAAEDGWYDDDPAGLIGQLYSELFRAQRLVVDTGLHAMGWTRQQAIDFGIEASEVERYVVMPGQACSYMIGQLKLVELRERARATLGERFSIREFHDVVLSAGVVPLAVLEREVEAHIAAEGDRASR